VIRVNKALLLLFLFSVETGLNKGFKVNPRNFFRMIPLPRLVFMQFLQGMDMFLEIAQPPTFLLQKK